MIVALTFIGPFVLSTAAIAQERDPHKMVWRALKAALSAPEGTEYFRNELKRNFVSATERNDSFGVAGRRSK